MRDAHRMKEKVDLSLDNRQITSLFVAGVVVLGAVFLIGVVVGKKLATPLGPVQKTDVLAALDQKAAQMEQARQDPPLTFQEELTRKTQDAMAPAEKTVVTADVKAPAAKPAESKPAAAKPAEAKIVTAKATETKPEAKVAVAKAEVASAQVKPAVAILPKMDGQVPAEPVPTRTSEKEDLHSAFARIEAAARKPAEGAFSVQIAASQNRPDAEAQVARLKAKGYSPYIVTATVPGKGVWYRVRLGSFSSREDASRYLDDFRRETRMDAFVAAAN